MARPEFLRKTVDLIDRAALNHVVPEVRAGVLERFVQDWRHHAAAPMLVELGDILHDLVTAAGLYEEDTSLLQALRDEKVEDLDDLKLLIAKADAYQKIEDLSPHSEIAEVVKWVESLKKSVDDAESEATAEELRAEIERLETALKNVTDERDAAEAKVKAMREIVA